MKKDYARLSVSIFCSFLGLALLIVINCGGSGDEGNISSLYPAIDEIAGTYSLIATLRSISDQCEGGASSYITPAIEISVSGNNVTVHQALPPPAGVYNSSDGSYSGGAGVLRVSEWITGTFRKSGSTITLTGTLLRRNLYCEITYDVVYTKH